MLTSLLAPFGELTAATAGELASIEVPEPVQQRVADLAAKRNEGEMTEDELAEYEMLVRYGNVLSVIKAQATKTSVGGA
ncbi:MAG: hypothetical protein RIC11_05925 [Botrimarina sp.]